MERLETLKTIQNIRNNNYFLFTWANPYYPVTSKINSFEELEAQLLTRLDAIDPALVDRVLLTPALGCYEGTKEPSVMLTLGGIHNQVDVHDTVFQLCQEMGQHSFIYRKGTQDKNWMHCGKTNVYVAMGRGLTIDNDAVDNYTLINGVKFALTFKQGEV